MQKIIRRTEKATRVAARQKARQDDHTKKGEAWERNQNRVRVVREQNQAIREDRVNRRIDWESGPLAPRRDVGDRAKTYGAQSMYNMMLPDKDPESRPKWSHIAEGDRAVIIRGRDKGKIGIVGEVNLEKAAVQVTGLNLLDIHLPSWLKQQNDDDRDIISHAQLIPIEDVKLVYPLPDPDTGIPRDVIVDRLQCVNRRFDKSKKEWDEGDRVIPGTNTIIPWPEKADPGYEDNEIDTLRISVEEQTFQPFLIRPPMPLTVVDELRNKYSRFRTRHDYEFRMEKELEDNKEEERKGLIRTMRTPLQELAEFKAAQKAQERRGLTDEQLAKIGEVMAQEQARRGLVVEQE
ncbi:hypothetical protein DOTSEDRAFT_57626 [Dothistroma septosporum NZE10]|uniref:KOW domain-containing protein n=1 Tax=Dothistroma septosporum (strain NZE10 / CBS 128990) TaxID=675120 RepID=N1PCK1_DOTSN|nr:hypothetical protein DOTSEDRAFT_57626 [Dothistroma septosporum NZE10]